VNHEHLMQWALVHVVGDFLNICHSQIMVKNGKNCKNYF